LPLKNLQIFYWLGERLVFAQARAAGKQIKEKPDTRAVQMDWSCQVLPVIYLWEMVIIVNRLLKKYYIVVI
jgi:hypothetical protein